MASSCSSADKFLKLKVDAQEGKLLRAALNVLVGSDQSALCAEMPDAFGHLCYKLNPCSGLFGRCTNLGTHRCKLLVDACTANERFAHVIFCDDCWPENRDLLGLSTCQACNEPIFDPAKDYHALAYRPGVVLTPDLESCTLKERVVTTPEAYHTGRDACGKFCRVCCRFIQGPVPKWAFVSVKGLYLAERVCIDCRGGGTDEDFITRNAAILVGPYPDFVSLDNCSALKRIVQSKSSGVRAAVLESGAPIKAAEGVIESKKRAPEAAPKPAKRTA